MKELKPTQSYEVVNFCCDSCGQQAGKEAPEFYEFVSVEHQCGYGSIHGDGNRINIDLCQHCFAGMCGDLLTVTDPFDKGGIGDPDDTRSSTHDILSANKITTDEELQVALKRVEQLWDAQYHCAEGNELHKLADLICVYEKKDWNSYFNQSPVASDDFMSDRPNIRVEPPNQEMGKASGILFDTPIKPNLDDDNSRQSAIDDEHDI